ncbi:MAG: hypothetical protein ACFE89_01760 [Candidatus Hodarchaeota archaeon]
MIWKVRLIKGAVQKFHDIQQIIGHYYELQQGWIHKLQSLIKNKTNYHIHLNVIKSVHGPKDTSLLVPFLLLLVTKTQLTVTFLGELTEDESAYLIGVWPDAFRSILTSDQQALLNLAYITVEKPHLIEELQLFF